MTPSGQTLCLCMIVKNEAHVIRRCLASVRPIIDHWIVVDTGSTDGTQDIVREAMASLPGEVVERPWVDFAHNRSEALALARPHGTYSLIIDADDELVLSPDFRLPDLDADSYSIDIIYGPTGYRRPQMIRNALQWRYRGVLHEFLECPAAKTGGHLPILMRINHEGRRSIDPQTYAKDAAILEKALAAETDPFLISRYTFYLAQSFRDCGEKAKAIDAYLRRAPLGFWAEEVFQSLYQAGRLMEALGRDPDEVIATYRRATEACPSRAEAAHAASRFCRGLSRYRQGYEIAKPAIGLEAPPAGLFVEPWIYNYGLLDEYAINAYWAGYHRDCLDACLHALQRGKVPEAERPRFLANMRFALDKLPGAEVAAPRSAAASSNGTRGTGLALAKSSQPETAEGRRIPFEGCPLCGGHNVSALKTADASGHPRHKPGIPRRMTWLSCGDCTHVFTDGYFAPAELEILFGESNAGQIVAEGFEASRKISANIVEKVSRYVGEGAWLDVGFGNASLLFTAQEYGWETVGLDLRPQNVDQLVDLGFEAHCLDIAEFDQPERFSTISMADVLEHMPFPTEGLTAAHRLLRQGGVLFVSMPNMEAPAWRLLGDHNPYWAEIEHYHNFSRTRLYQLLSEFGFEPMEYGISQRYRVCMEVIARRS